MSVIAALGHIAGAITVQFAFGIGLMLFSRWEEKRNQKIFLQDASLALGIPIGDLENPEYKTRFVQFIAERYSSELLRNRLSDAC